MRFFSVLMLLFSFSSLSAFAETPLEGNWQGMLHVKKSNGEEFDMNCSISIAVVGNYLHFIDSRQCTYMPLTMKLEGSQIFLRNELVGELTANKLSFHQSIPKFEYTLEVILANDGSIQLNDHFFVPTLNEADDTSGSLGILE